MLNLKTDKMTLLEIRNKRMKIQSYKNDQERLREMKQSARLLNNISKEGMECMLDDIDFLLGMVNSVLERLENEQD